MAIGERIRYIRNLRGMTQKYLGMAIGFSENTADVRMAQYESGSRTPKEKTIADIARVLGVSPLALTIPDIDTDLGLIHTLFALEDIYGLTINRIEGKLCLTLDAAESVAQTSLLDRFAAWQREAKRLRSGDITKEDYDAWRYTFPEAEAEQTRQRLDEKRAEAGERK